MIPFEIELKDSFHCAYKELKLFQCRIHLLAYMVFHCAYKELKPEIKPDESITVDISLCL